MFTRALIPEFTMMGLFFLLMLMLMIAAPVVAAPIPVRFTEGATHGYLLLRDDRGNRIADGEMIQKTRGDVVDAQLIFHFKDGSLHDERVTFTQNHVFSLQTYRLIQRGPSFPVATDLAMDRKTGEYRVRTVQSGSADKTLRGRLDFPDDVSNGMVVTLLRNLTGDRRETVHVIAFTPEPKAVPLELVPATKTTVRIGDLAKQMTQYVLEPKLDGLTMFFGKLLGKLPRAFHYHFWLLTEDVPAFGGFEGPLYLHGPTWRIEQTGLPNFWPSQVAATGHAPR